MTAAAWIDEIAWPADGPPWLAVGLSRIREDAWLLNGLAPRRSAVVPWFRRVAETAAGGAEAPP